MMVVQHLFNRYITYFDTLETEVSGLKVKNGHGVIFILNFIHNPSESQKKSSQHPTINSNTAASCIG